MSGFRPHQCPTQIECPNSGCYMLQKLKKIAFLVAKYTGFFHATRRLYRNKIRFLCYHGFTLDNESKFLPQLFIDPVVFSERMRYLKTRGYNVISLDQAIEALRAGIVPDDAVVLTIDDGFYGVFAEAAPILQSYNFPATLYLTSYYFDQDCPIYSLAVKYMFWSTKNVHVDLTTLCVPGLAEYNSSDDRLNCIDLLVEYGQSLETNEARIQLLERLGFILGVDYDLLNASRKMGLIKSEELQNLLLMNVDIQMHTHRHDFPLDLGTADYELRKNREKVDPLLPQPMRHFCYPSGLWNETQWTLLEARGIDSATTCLPGLMSDKMSLYAIPRFLDGANISQIEYESELAGFSEFCRKFKFSSRIKATK
jgi:peptidoglycan/xylan/chitin deacetylase (PgdA/CDA1 family)